MTDDPMKILRDTEIALGKIVQTARTITTSQSKNRFDLARSIMAQANNLRFELRKHTQGDTDARASG